MSKRANAAVVTEEQTAEIPEKIDEVSSAEICFLMEIPLETLPINVTLPCTVYLKQNDKTLVFKRQGEKVNYKMAFEMQKKGTETVWIHKAFWELFMISLEEDDPSFDRRKVTPGGHLQQLLMSYGQELEKRLKEPKGPLFEKLKLTANGISKAVWEEESKAKEFLRKDQDSSLYFVNHSVNTAVYAAVVGRRLGLSEEQVHQLTYATLVHDVGYLLLPKQILHRASALSSDEEQTFRSHPKRGAELLYSVNASGEVVRAVLQHHECLDGTGYPSGLKGMEVEIFARIISVVDHYDDLTSNRPNGNAISIEEAMKRMRALGDKVDQALVAMIPIEY